MIETPNQSPAPVMNNQLAAQSADAEQAVLGGIIQDTNAWEKVSDKLVSEDFSYPANKMIFQAMETLTLRSLPIDCITLCEQLASQQLLEKCGGEAYIYDLANNVPSISNIVAYADIVREHSVLSQLVSVANDISASAINRDGKSSPEILDRAERLIFEISETRSTGSGPQDINSLLTKTSEQLQFLFKQKGQITGVPTSFTDLDEKTSGLQKGSLVIVAGRPSMGKTVMLVNLAESCAITTKKPVLIFSLEMPAESIVMRMLSSLGRINQQKLRSGQLDDEDWPRVMSVVSLLSQYKIFIDDTPAITPNEMRSRARRIAREHGELGMIAVDYLQLMTSGENNENRATEISNISRNLKALAKELNVPVVAGSQLNRGLEQRPDKRPVMSDLRESGAIEQDADLIMFIYRDEVYHPDSMDKGTAEIIIGKQRNGPIGKVRLTFQGEFVRFDNHIANPLTGGMPQ